MRTLTLDVFIESYKVDENVRYTAWLVSLQNTSKKGEVRYVVTAPATPEEARREAIRSLRSLTQLETVYEYEGEHSREQLLELVANSTFWSSGSELVRVGRNFTFKKKLGGKLISIRMRFFHWRMGKPAPNDLLTVAAMVAQKRYKSGLNQPRC